MNWFSLVCLILARVDEVSAKDDFSFFRIPSAGSCAKALWISDSARFKGYPIPKEVNFGEFLKQSVESFHHPAKVLETIQERSGNFAMIDLALGKVMVVSDPAIAVAIMKNTDRDANSPFIKSEIVRGPFAGLVGRHNIFSENDFEKWVEKRKSFSGHFNAKTSQSEITREKITKVVNRRIEVIRQASREKRKIDLDLKNQMASLTLEVLLDSFFTETLAETELNSLNDAFGTIMHSFPVEALNPTQIPVHLLPTVTTYQLKLKKAHAVIDHFVESMIARRLSIPIDQRPSDLFTQMIVYFNDNQTQKNRGSLLNEMKTFILSGHETTSAGLTWTFYRLMKETPKLALPKDDDAIRSLWNETLFKYPPAYVLARKAVSDFVSTDERGRSELIPAGMEVLVPIASLHRAMAQGGHAQKVANAAFGSGPRVCLGLFFANVESEIILKSFLSAFEFSPLFNEVKNTSSGSLQVAENLPTQLSWKK